jgi:hypothetical protein
MFRWYVRYLPYAFVLWLAERHLETFKLDVLEFTHPFENEFIGRIVPKQEKTS